MTAARVLRDLGLFALVVAATAAELTACRPGASGGSGTPGGGSSRAANRASHRAAIRAARRARRARLSLPGGVGVPYPVGEPERVEGWSRAALARSSFAAVFSATDDDAFPRHVPGPALAMVGTMLRPEPDAEAWKAILDLAFSGKTPQPGTATTVPRTRVEALGHQPAAPSVFVVGEAGNCRAEVQDARVGYYLADGPVLQIDWTLSGCAEGPWAPVAVVSNRLPEDSTWVDAELGLDASYAGADGWQGPLSESLVAPTWTGPDDPPLQIVRVLQIPSVLPTVVEVYDSLVAKADDATHDDYAGRGLDPACADEQATTINHGFWNGSLFDAFVPSPTADDVHLLGAIVRAGQIDALVYDQRLDPLVVVPPAPTLDGDTGWTRRVVPSGAHEQYARDSWGYLPTSDPSPVGPPCAPRDAGGG